MTIAEQIIEHLKRGPATPSALAAELSLKPNSVRVACRRLAEAEDGLVEDYHGAYRLTRDPDSGEPVTVMMVTKREHDVLQAMRG